MHERNLSDTQLRPNWHGTCELGKKTLEIIAEFISASLNEWTYLFLSLVLSFKAYSRPLAANGWPYFSNSQLFLVSCLRDCIFSNQVIIMSDRKTIPSYN